jgi:DNA polymerase II small subunit
MKNVAEPLYSARAMLSLGNPAEVQLHGVNFLLHHGRSLDDIIATIPGMSFRNPVRGMEFQLKCRHLVPEYGKRTAIAPERVDHLVIDRPPDVFQSGHIHVAQHSVYRGTRVVNSGAWQAQTDYQRRLGLTPTPGILPIVNLQTLDVSMINFLTPLE